MSQCSIQRFDLSEVPAGLKHCVYPEELARDFVQCPRSVYLIVLALRHILTESVQYLDSYDHYETPKVFWRWHDEHGFRTDIIIHRDEVNEWDPYVNDMRVTQKYSWHELATVQCSGGEGLITHVNIDSVPYGRIEFDGEAGIRRLIDDAARSRHAIHLRMGDRQTWQIYHSGGYSTHLGYTLNTDTVLRYGVTVDVKVESVVYR